AVWTAVAAFAMSFSPGSRDAGLKSHPQVEAEDSTRSTFLQPLCRGPVLIRTYVLAGLLLAAAQTLEGGPRLVVETVRYPRGTLLGVLDRLHVAEEGLGGQRLHLATGGRANGRVRRHHADSLARSVLCCKPLDQRIRVLRKTHLERTAHLVLSDSVEDEHAAGAAQ